MDEEQLKEIKAILLNALLEFERETANFRTEIAKTSNEKIENVQNYLVEPIHFEILKVALMRKAIPITMSVLSKEKNINNLTNNELIIMKLSSLFNT